MADEVGAKARLEAAVKRLEVALGRTTDHSGANSQDVKHLHREMNNLESNLADARTKNERLSEELAQTKAEYLKLQNAMDKLSTRLDGAIDTVQALLEE